MEKYYWNPTREDRVGVCMGIFQHDNVNRADVEKLVSCCHEVDVSVDMYICVGGGSVIMVVVLILALFLGFRAAATSYVNCRQLGL